MFKSSHSSLASFFSHLQRWDRSCLYEGYRVGTYLRHWGFVTQIIALKFLQDSWPLLLGAIRANISSPFPFQIHFNWARDILLVATKTSIFQFKHLLKRKMNHI
jgi:hypothetical protein